MKLSKIFRNKLPDHSLSVKTFKIWRKGREVSGNRRVKRPLDILTMVVFSPIAATYGVRVEQLLETPQDFQRYHEKLNRKLQKLRHRCQLISKDTKRYSATEKYSKVSSADYDHKNKLYGVLVLLHAERDLALAETLKLRARQRGKLKRSEKKILGTRLKKVVKTTNSLVELTKNEKQWITRAQYIAYAKLAQAEYLLNGKFLRHKDSSSIASNLALCFATWSFLCDLKILSSPTFELLQSKYEYSLKQHAGNILSASDMHNYVVNEVKEAGQKGDELANLIISNGFKTESRHIATEKGVSIKTIKWRAFTAQVRDSQVEQLIQEAEKIVTKDASNYDDKLLKWQQALEKQETRIAYHEDVEDEDEEGSMGSLENDQILLAFIKYNALFTSILRDNFLFNQLWKQWSQIGTSMTSKMTKYKEIDRIVKNLVKYLGDVMEVPGVYSDDDLMAQLQLCQLYFKLTLISGCLGSMYQSKGKFVETLALHVDSHQKLESALSECGELNEVLLPENILTKGRIESLRRLIKTGWKSVLVSAKYQKSLKAAATGPYEPSLIERGNWNKVKPAEINIDNLFPLRPKLRPVQSKPTLFDLAFNYINYDNKESQASDLEDTAPEEQEPPEKRGFWASLTSKGYKLPKI